MSVLGIDTSCYTTSVSLVDGDRLLADNRSLLVVPAGGRGLQQSNALFQHVQNLPRLIEGMILKDYTIDAVAVSTRPRPETSSYMPVFTAGHSVARSIASVLSVPCFETSHQEGHVAAGCFSLGFQPVKSFLAFHISGGTTEILKVNPESTGFQLELLGGTSDLHAGQVVDRVGVALGLGFPAGAELEKLALQFTGTPGKLPIKANVKGLSCSLSGAESSAQRLISANADKTEVAFEVQRCLTGVFTAMAASAVESTNLTDILVIGGVASNEYIRREMRKTLEALGMNVMFAVNPFSSDNAVGVADIGQKFLHRGT
jgi:N6-L-threonylcarbamoyladenine synthase